MENLGLSTSVIRSMLLSDTKQESTDTSHIDKTEEESIENETSIKKGSSESQNPKSSLRNLLTSKPPTSQQKPIEGGLNQILNHPSYVVPKPVPEGSNAQEPVNHRKFKRSFMTLEERANDPVFQKLDELRKIPKLHSRRPGPMSNTHPYVKNMIERRRYMNNEQALYKVKYEHQTNTLHIKPIICVTKTEASPSNTGPASVMLCSLLTGKEDNPNTKGLSAVKVARKSEDHKEVVVSSATGVNILQMPVVMSSSHGPTKTATTTSVMTSMAQGVKLTHPSVTPSMPYVTPTTPDVTPTGPNVTPTALNKPTGPLIIRDITPEYQATGSGTINTKSHLAVLKGDPSELEIGAAGKVKYHICQDCGLVFTSKKAWNEHRGMGHLEAQFPGISHEKIVIELVPYAIEENKRKIFEARTDSRARAYKCSSCRLVFKRLNDLKKHMNTHPGGHVCLTCGKTFPYPSTLQEHIKGHKKGKSSGNKKGPKKAKHTQTSTVSWEQCYIKQKWEHYMCPFCRIEFTEKSDCHGVGHMLQEHPEFESSDGSLQLEAEHKQDASSDEEEHVDEMDNKNDALLEISTHECIKKDYPDSNTSIMAEGESFDSGENVDFAAVKIKQEMSDDNLPFVCPVCGMGYTTKQACLDHFTASHPEVDIDSCKAMLQLDEADDDDDTQDIDMKASENFETENIKTETEDKDST